ncbi:MAG: hypothetical protein ABI855_19045 [Bacteroidota bacterium]
MKEEIKTELKENVEDKTTEKYLDQLYKSHESSTTTLDKNMLYVASGALGLSLTYIKQIIDITNIKLFWLLCGSWILLTMAILFSLLMHKSSLKYIDFLIKNVYQNIDEKELEEKVKRNKAEFMNTVALLSLISGIALLLLFVLINIKK